MFYYCVFFVILCTTYGTNYSRSTFLSRLTSDKPDVTSFAKRQTFEKLIKPSVEQLTSYKSVTPFLRNMTSDKTKTPSIGRLTSCKLVMSTTQRQTFSKIRLTSTDNSLSVTSHSPSVSLHGIGATFPSAVYDAWMPVFQYERQRFVDVDNSFEERCSLDGKQALMRDKNGSLYAYGASDAVLTDEERENYPDIVALPAMAG